MATAVVTGTITSSTTESDIVAGGKTIIITLTGDTWIPESISQWRDEFGYIWADDGTEVWKDD